MKLVSMALGALSRDALPSKAKETSNSLSPAEAMSQDAKSVDVFVSHNWSQPADWEKMMGTSARIWVVLGF